MEFQFNVNEYFKRPIVEIKSTLLPPDFAGDRRALWNTVNKVAEVVNEMGEASAHAQGLNKPITTAERLRQSDQSLYLLVDQEENNGNGAVTGMLKVGKKGLYVFDRDGQHYQVTPPCILDFYVHEKKQRSGLGKKLFEHMLEKENIKPHNLAIDRPSEKFLNFLRKHYNLQTPIKQMNNYVVFDGFFPDTKKEAQSENSPMNRTNGLQSACSNNAPSYGRYGAPRPPCSMGQIIHNTTSQKNSEPASPNYCNPQDNPTSHQCQIQNHSNQVQPHYNEVYLQQKNYIPSSNFQQNPPGNSITNQGATVPPFQQQYPMNSLQQQNPQYAHGQNMNQNYENQNNPYVQPLQEQIRMFPEKEMQARNSAYPTEAYSREIIHSNQNYAQANTEPPRHIYPTQNHPQQVYQTSQVPQVQQFQQSQIIEPQRYQQGIPQVAGHPSSGLLPQQAGYSHQQQNHMPNDSSLQFNQNQQQASQQYVPQQLQVPQRQLYTPQQQQHFPQPVQQETTRYQQVTPQTSNQRLYSQQISHQQQLAPQTPLHDVPPQNNYHQQILYRQDSSSQVQQPDMNQQQLYHQHQLESSPTYTPPTTQEYRYIQPSTQDRSPKKPVQSERHQTQQRVREEKQDNKKKNMESETVSSLLQVDPKYFKSDPIQLKQPPQTPVAEPPQTSQYGKRDDTVATLLRAEEEFFEGGQLRDKYRTNVESEGTSVPQQQPRQELYHQQNYMRQPQPPQQIPAQMQYTSQEQYVSRQASPEQAPITPQQHYVPQSQLQYQQQYNTPQQQNSPDPYIPQQQYSPTDQYRTQQHLPSPDPYRSQQQYSSQDQYTPQQQYSSPEQFRHQQQEQQLPSPDHYVPSQYYKPQQFSANQQQIETAQSEHRAEPQQLTQEKSAEHKGPEVSQYSVENAQIKTADQGSRVEMAAQEADQKLEPQMLEDRPVETCESKTGSPRLSSTIRQSSYIANDFNAHADGPARTSAKAKTDVAYASVEQSGERKKGLNRQYGLNDSDMRRKGYKSAIVKRYTDVQEHDTLEFGYPPQVNKNVTTPRAVAESVTNSPKIERPKSLEIQVENSVHEPEVKVVEEEPEDEADGNQENDIEPEIEKLNITENLSSPPMDDDSGSGKKTPRHLTEQGYFDLKFYHNKLW